MPCCDPPPARLTHPTAEPHRPLPCPRCDSSNTKFCYFNNYNLAQPRHFCKSCRRYWTQGGTLRDVPVGGSTRKSAKRCRVAAAAAAAAAAGSTASSFFIPRPLLETASSPSLGGFGGGAILGDGVGCMGSSSSYVGYCGGGGSSSGVWPAAAAGIGEGRGFNEYWRWAGGDSPGFFPSSVGGGGGGDCFCWQEGVAGFVNQTALASALNVFK